MKVTSKKPGIPAPAVLLFGLLALAGSAAAAQEGPPAAQPDAQAAEEQTGPQYKFNLAAGKNAPGAQAEVLLTAKAEGGYMGELTVSSLPAPSTLGPKAVTYVVWLYDPATQKKERVAELATEAGAGSASFEIAWSKFALVVTAEPSAEPQEWSGIAVLTGQPALPENAAVAKGEAAPAEAAAPEGPAVGGAKASAPGEGAAEALAEAAVPAAEPAPAAEPRAAAPGPQAPAAPARPGAAPEPEAAAAAGAAHPGGVEEGEEVMGGAEAAVSAEEEEGNGKKKKVRNEALDAMAAAARGEEEPEQPKAENKEEGNPELDAMAAAARGPAVAARIELEGTGKAPDAKGRIEVGADGTARLSATKLPPPSEMGAQLNSFVLWSVDPTSGESKPLGALQGLQSGSWTLLAAGLEIGSALMVTAEPGPEPTARGGPVVLAGRWEDD